MKKCTQCNELKVLTQFGLLSQSKDGHRSICKICHNDNNKQYALLHKNKIKQQQKEWKNNNIEKISQYKKEWRLNNQEKIKQYKKEYYIKNFKIIKEKQQKYIKDNLKAIALQKNQWRIQKRNSDIVFKLTETLRARIFSAIKNQSGIKAKKSLDLLGASGKEVKQYIESLWQHNMSWNNYGTKNNQWQIDHIIPVTAFDVTKAAEQKKCFHYTNLMPLWKQDNLEKSNKIFTVNELKVWLENKGYKNLEKLFAYNV
jgi:hypothetical protein